MNSLFLLIPVTLILLLVAAGLFIWAVNHDQFDDLESPSSRILFDDDEQATIAEFRDQQARKQQAKNRRAK